MKGEVFCRKNCVFLAHGGPISGPSRFLVQPVRLAEVLYIGAVYRVKGTRGQGHMRCGGALFTCLGLVPVQYTVFYIPTLMGFN